MNRVFVSSVYSSLKPVRREVVAALQKARYDVAAMELWAADDQPPLDVCLRELQRSDIVVLIIGPGYGTVLQQGISYTHAEYREARARGIPVLAIVVPPTEDLQPEERELLQAFVTEVGSTALFDRLDTSDRVPTAALAALAAAQALGTLGKRLTFLQSAETFFAPYLRDTPAVFDHHGPFIGHANALQSVTNFIKGQGRLLILKGQGGSGKSRLLLEATRAASATPDAPTVRFVDPGAQWSADDIAQLAPPRVVVILDDAHRRPDLDRLLEACLRQNPDVRWIISCRNSAIDMVKSQAGPLLGNEEYVTVELSSLPENDAIALAKHYLGQPLAHLADQLVRLADANLLVTRVGAYCIADRRMPPELLSQKPEAFRRAVLDRLLDDPTFNGQSSIPPKPTLQVIAAIGPINTEDESLITTMSAYLKIKAHELRQQLASLEHAGFLLRRGRLVRTSPDVLGDHLLHSAALDANGKPTGFVDDMVKAFAPAYFANILGNAAELDWRAATNDGPPSVLSNVWREVLRSLPCLHNTQRVELVGMLRRPAFFAPAQALEVCEWLAAHPDAPKDEQRTLWGLDDAPDRVFDAITRIFAIIAHHEAFTVRCLKWLWKFAVQDTRPTNPNPAHPRRQLQEFMEYQRWNDWQDEDGLHARTTSFLVQRLSDPHEDGMLSWAIEVLGTGLNRLGEANESNRATFTIGQFSLAPFHNAIKGRRASIVSCLRTLALNNRVSEAAAAVREIGQLTRKPHGPFGQSLDDSDFAVWLPEAKSAISLLADISNDAPAEAVRYLSRHQLRSVQDDRWPDLEVPLASALALSKPVTGERLYDLLGGMPFSERLRGYQEERDRVNSLCKEAAESLWRQHGNAAAIVTTVLDGIAVMHIAGQGEQHVGELIQEIVANRADQMKSVVDALTDAGDKAWPMLRPAILKVHSVDQALAYSMVETLSKSPMEILRATAADALQYMLDTPTDTTNALAIATSLVADQSPLVKQCLAQVWRGLRKSYPTESLRGVLSIEWNGDPSVASAVLRTIDEQYGFSPSQLSSDDIELVLRRIDPLPSLDERNREVIDFVNEVSARAPRAVVEMLLRRIDATSEHRGAVDRWTPIPHLAHGIQLFGITRSPERNELLRMIRDRALEHGTMKPFWASTLFHVAAGVDAGLTVLREWVKSGDPQKVSAAAYLFRGYDHSLVFTAHSFVAELLDAAEPLGDETLQHVRSELFALALGGTFHGSPGKPAPRRLSDKASADSTMKLYRDKPVVEAFYRDLLHTVERDIRRDAEQWEEEGL